MPAAPADKCVLDSCRYMQQRGWDVTYLPVQSDGLVDMRALEAAMRPDTAIVSVMLVNNEIGARLCSAGACQQMWCGTRGAAVLWSSRGVAQPVLLRGMHPMFPIEVA